MKTDILAFGAHPDDVELGCAGTMIKMAAAGYITGVVDLTAGELGTRGDSITRLKEAEPARILMGASFRENLGMKDGFFENNEANKISIARMIRKYRPRVVLCNAVSDRHPDHGRASALVSDGCFIAGLRRVEIRDGDTLLEPWRPVSVYHYVQDRYMKPDFIIDISGFFEAKMDAVKAFTSQFYNPGSSEPETPISSALFMDFLKSRCIEYGRLIGAEFGEGFVVERPIGIEDIMTIK